MVVEQKKSVMFVTQSADASTLFTRWFEHNPYLSKQYFIVGTLATRELALKEVQKKKVDLIIFVDRTTGEMSLSETIYHLRMYDARIIYISAKRRIGDLVLDAIVGYGVYDIITSSSVTEDRLVNLIKYPNKFSDVAIMHRMVEVSDTTGIHGTRKFKVLGLEEYLANGSHLAADYLTDPAEQFADSAKTYVNKKKDEQSTKTAIYHERVEDDKTYKQPVKHQAKKQTTGLGDIDSMFD